MHKTGFKRESRGDPTHRAFYTLDLVNTHGMSSFLFGPDD